MKFNNRLLKTDKAYLILQMAGKKRINLYKVLQIPFILNPGSLNEDTTSANRFNDNEEPRYSLRSLERFAPWPGQTRLYRYKRSELFVYLQGG